MFRSLRTLLSAFLLTVPMLWSATGPDACQSARLAPKSRLHPNVAGRALKSRCLVPLMAGTAGKQLQITELKMFVHADGKLFNQYADTAAEFSYSLDAQNYGDILFSYTNKTGATQTKARFLAFVDLDIDRNTNGYTNEYGAFVSLTTPPAAPAGAIAATSWEIDEPGFVFGTIYQHLTAGALINKNSAPSSAPDDVSTALGFDVGDIAAGATVTAALRISRIDIGGLKQVDPDSNLPVWLNGFAVAGAVTQPPVTPPSVTPAPPSLILVLTGIGAGVLRRFFPKKRNAGTRVSSHIGLVLCVAALSLLATDVVGQSLPDLTVDSLNTSGVVTDSQTLAISGNLVAVIKNIGSAAVSKSYRVLAWEDRNGNGKFDNGVDLVLGYADQSASLAVGASTNVSIPLGGGVLFKGNLIWAQVDSLNVVPESDETNNIRNTGQASKYVPPAGALNPYVKWKKETFTVLPDFNQVVMTPAVIDLNSDGAPEIIFSSYVSGTINGGGTVSGVLRAISGRDGSEVWTVTDSQYAVEAAAGLAVGDIDLDGKPEIVCLDIGHHLIAFEHDGTFKWRGTDVLPSRGFGTSYNWGAPSIADVDGDGIPEIIFGAAVFTNNGILRWRGAAGQGDNIIGPLSTVADINLDGKPEIVAGNTVYRPDGTILWQAPVPDGFPAVGNFDGDSFAEVVLVSAGSVYLLDHNGQVQWGPVAIPGGGNGGPPTIADFDGDGKPEIGVAGAFFYAVFNGDGTLKWSSPIHDYTSNVTGSSVFDFEGDGKAEVVYADELYLRVYRGSDGTVLFQIPKSSGTTYEYPVIVDVDGDGRAEIVAVANNWYDTGAGIMVIAGADNNWVNTRKIWNQHSYHITNVNEDGTIPRYEQPNWLVPGLNNFRLNTFLPSEGSATAVPDIVPSFIRKNDAAFPASVQLTARIGNGGSAKADAGVTVSFYRGDPAAGGRLIGNTQTSQALAPGAYEDVAVTWTNPTAGLHPIVVVADGAVASTEIIRSTFDSDTESWQYVLPGQSIPVHATLGGPAGGYITITDTGDEYSYLRAPAKFLGDRSALYGSVLSYDYRATGWPPIRPTRLILGGAGLLLARNGEPAQNDTWTHVEVPLLASTGWHVVTSVDAPTEDTGAPAATEQQLHTVLANLDLLLIFFDFNNGLGDNNRFDIDNVVLGRVSLIHEGDTTNNKAGANILLGIGPFPLVDDLLARFKDGGVQLTWTQVAGAARYNIYRRTAGGALQLIRGGIVAPPFVDQDTGLANGTTYAYSVRWVDSSGRESGDGTIASATPAAGSRSSVSPTILSTPSTRAMAGTAYAYQVRASDPDVADTLTLSLTIAPAGMTINAQSGLIQWIPGNPQAGYSTVEVRVQDRGGRYATQNYQLFTDFLVVNSPPVITSTPATNGSTGDAYVYQVKARDPQGGLLAFSLDQAPSAMGINSSTGTIQWTPALTQIGASAVTVRATDLDGLYATQSYSVNVVRGNHAPKITSTPLTVGRVGAAYQYQVTAADPDVGDTLTYSLTAAPAGMTIQAATGLIGWTPVVSQLGTQAVTATATDSGGLTASQVFVVTVAAAVGPPIITSTPVAAGEVSVPYAYRVLGSGALQGDVLVYALETAPSGMTINTSSGLVNWSPTAPQVGANSVTVKVTDPRAQVARQSYAVAVTTRDSTPPEVDIASPTVGATINTDLTVIGTVRDDNLRNWTLAYQALGSSNWVTIGSGTGAVVNGPLGVFPATTVRNSQYRIGLTAWDNYQSSFVAVDVLVDTGALKMGDFTLTFNDLQVPAMGIPISITRTYDTKRLQNGDFGLGWTLGFSGADLTVAGDGSVFVTLPGGRRSRFAWTPYSGGWFPVYTNAYTPGPGTYDKLENLDCPMMFGGNGVLLCGGVVYNPQNFLLTTRNGMKYTLTVSGGISRMEDRNGNWIQIDSAGVTASSGRSVPFLRDGAGRIVSITDTKGNRILYNYDGSGRLVKSTDQNGTDVSYAYYQDTAYLTEMRRTGGCSPVKKEYDSGGRVTAAIDELGNRTTYAYDVTGRTITSTDPVGGVTVKHLDASGNIVELDDAAGGITRYTYDANNNQTSVIYPSGRSVVRTYDTNGLLTIETSTPVSGIPLVTTYAYNDLRLIDTITHPLGDKVTYEYDAQGNVTAHKYRTAAGTVVSADTWTYDSNGQPMTWVDGAGKTTTYAYNSFGDLVTRTGPDGAAVSFEYDAAANPVAVTDAAGIRTTMTRDAMSHVLAVQQGGKTVSSFTYDALGRMASLTDGLGQTTGYTHNCPGNLTSVTTPDGKTTSYTIHPLGPLASVTDASNRTTAFSYDKLGRQTGRTTAAGTTWSWGYTPDSLPALDTFPGGGTASRQFDGHDRLARETRPDRVTELTIDNNGNLTKATVTAYRQRRETSLTYDGIGRLTGTTDWAGRPVSYTLDARNLRTSMSVSGTPDTTYQYDAAGRITEVRTGSQFVDYTYNAAGKLIRKTASNGVVTDYAYDARARLVDVTTHLGATVITSHHYTLNDNSLRTTVNYADGSATYSYDMTDRLASESVTSASLGSFARTYTYDATGSRLYGGASYGTDNRLLSDSGGSYGYDANGNRTSYAGKTYSYDSANRMTAFTGGGHAAAYEYDYSGRRAARVVDGVRREYVYDGGNLVGEAVGAGAAISTRYTFGPGVDEPLFMTTGGKTYFYHADGHGSVWAMTDESGNVVQRYGYDAWGVMRVASGSLAFTGSGPVNTLTYAGREYDGESGLYYMRARAYDPAAGLFLQRDPLQGSLDLPGTQHPYAFVSGNPVSGIDPSGQQEFIEFTIAGPPEQMAAIVGYVQGYAVTNLTFMGEFMQRMNSGETLESIWDAAVAATSDKIDKIGENLGLIATDTGKGASLFAKIPLDDAQAASSALGGVVSIVNSFATGAHFSAEFGLGKLLQDSITTVLGDSKAVKYIAGRAASAVDAELEKEKIDLTLEFVDDYGGFKNGANVAMIGLMALRPH